MKCLEAKHYPALAKRAPRPAASAAAGPSKAADKPAANSAAGQIAGIMAGMDYYVYSTRDPLLLLLPAYSFVRMQSNNRW